MAGPRRSRCPGPTMRPERTPDREATLEGLRAGVEAALDRALPSETTWPATIPRAVRYSLFAGGKRIRPVLVLAAGDAVGSDPAETMPLACAVEMIHTYSLIHDDLPAMDNDDLRRGKPTSHKVFGEAIAILAGDALLTRAVHLESEGRPVDAASLERLHRAKTGALLGACVRGGAILGGASEQDLGRLTRYASAIGLAFQVVDDVLDATEGAQRLGKTAGKDQAARKATYVSVHGLDRARALAAELRTQALEAIAPLGPRGSLLGDLARLIVDRH